jgi:hypothetical protein
MDDAARYSAATGSYDVAKFAAQKATPPAIVNVGSCAYLRDARSLRPIDADFTMPTHQRGETRWSLRLGRGPPGVHSPADARERQCRTARAPSAQEHRRALPCRPARPGGPGHEAASQRGPGGLHPSGLDQLLARPSVGARSNPRSRIRPLTVTRSSHASSPHSRRSSSRCVPCVTLRCRRNAPGVRGPTGRPSHGPRCWNDPSGGPDGTAALA